MKSPDYFGPFDTVTFEILARRWRTPSRAADVLHCEALAGYRQYLQCHGLVGVLLRYHADDIVKHFGQQFLNALRVDYLVAASKAQQSIRCIRSVADAFEKSGVSWVLLKGVALSQRLYGDPMVRQSMDVDLLVDHKQMRDAHTALQAAGFRLGHPRPLPGTLRARAWRSSIHHDILFSPDNVKVELHWRSDFSPQLSLPSLPMLKPFTEVTAVNGILIPHLAGSCLVTQIARHGYRSIWQRWKWLYDIVEVVQQLPTVDQASGAQLSNEPALTRSLRLAEKLMELPFGALGLATGGGVLSREQVSRLVYLRDQEILHNQHLEGSGKSGVPPSDFKLRSRLAQLAFQTAAFKRLPEKAAYVGWRLYRPIFWALASDTDRVHRLE